MFTPRIGRRIPTRAVARVAVLLTINMTYREMKSWFIHTVFVVAVVAMMCGCHKGADYVEPLSNVPLRLSVASATTDSRTRAGESTNSTIRPGDDNGQGGTYGSDDFTSFTSGDVAMWCALYNLPASPVHYSSDFFLENVIFRYYDISGGLFASSSSNAYWRLDKAHNFYVCQPVPQTVEDYQIPFTVDEHGINGEANPSFSYARMMGVVYDAEHPNLDVYLVPQLARVDVNIQAGQNVGDVDAYQLFGVRVKINSSAKFSLTTGSWTIGDEQQWITVKRLADCENPEELMTDYVLSVFPNTLSVKDTPTVAAILALQININNVWYEVTNLQTASGGIIPFTPSFITTLTVTVNKANSTYNNLLVNFTGWHQENTYNGTLQ